MEVNLKKNFIFLSIYKLFEMLLPMITSPLLSRRLGASALGEYTYYYSIVSMFIVVAELGCYSYGIREIAKIRDDQKKLDDIHSEIFFIHFINGLLWGVLYISFLRLIGELYLVRLIMVLFIISNMIDNSFLYIGIERIGPLTLRDSVIKIISFVFIVLLVKKPDDLLVYVLIMTLSTLICRFISLVFSFKYVSFKIPKLENLCRHYKPMFALTIPPLASVIYHSMDRIMIGLFYNNADIGYYECASKALIPRNIITALGTVLAPGIANLYFKEEIDKVKVIFKNSFIVSMIFAYAFMFGISAIAEQFAPWFWGEEFAICSPLLVGLSITIPIWTIGEVLRNQYLLPIGRDKEYVVSFIAGVLTNAFVNILLIPKFGVMGAIIATIVAEFIMSFFLSVFVRTELKISIYIAETLPYLIIGSIMLLVLEYLNIENIFSNYNMAMVIIIKVILGAVLFLTLSIIYENIAKKKYLISLFKSSRD